MSRFPIFSIILFTFVIINCHGFDLSMERKNFSLKGQSYCGLLRCQVETITEEKVSSLIKMDIYYLYNRTLIATILSKDPEIQTHIRKVNVTGSMSDHHGELRLYFTERGDCMESDFICRINFFLASGQTDFSENSTLSNYREKHGHDLYIKSQISYEQTVSDQSGFFLKNLISPNDFLKNRMAFSFQTENSDSSTPEKNIEVTKNSLMSQKSKHEPDLKQVLSELESRMVYMYNFSMTELLMNISKIYEHQKNINVIDMQQRDTKLQEVNNNTLLELNKKLNSMINKVENSVSRKELNQSNDDQINIKLSLESISKQVNDLFKSQETSRENLANFNSIVTSLKLKEQLGESLAYLNSTVVTSLKLQETLRECLDNLNSTDTPLKLQEILRECFDNLNSTVTSLKLEETLRESFANLNSKVLSLNLQEKKIPSDDLKCERGMNSSLKPREVMTINSKIKTLCDTKTDGGGWIIIQRRVKGDITFNVGWDMYKHGFGSLQGDFWLGNDVISNLTLMDRYMLRIDMRCENVDSYAVYDYFQVENETQLYTLLLGAYHGNASDHLTYNKDMKFTTHDRDNDAHPSINCANHEYQNSGWWFNGCSYSNLNGVWGGRVSKNYVYWVQGKECSFVEMKLRKVMFGVSDF